MEPEKGPFIIATEPLKCNTIFVRLLPILFLVSHDPPHAIIVPHGLFMIFKTTILFIIIFTCEIM